MGGMGFGNDPPNISLLLFLVNMCRVNYEGGKWVTTLVFDKATKFPTQCIMYLNMLFATFGTPISERSIEVLASDILIIF